ncbi:MAG: winged helix-turn-helix domain-containing protein [Promethearchaeota archaeon]
MSLNQFKHLFEALDNERRIQLYEYILQKGFVSKSELAKNFDLKRASLNHHLSIMFKAGLVFEKNLILDGRAQSFIIPAVKLHPDRFIEHREDFQHLSDLLERWVQKNLTIRTSRELREAVHHLNLSSDILASVEARLFSILERKPANTGYCYICRVDGAEQFCYVCKNRLCEVHSHYIKREDQKALVLCPNCVEKFFG